MAALHQPTPLPTNPAPAPSSPSPSASSSSHPPLSPSPPPDDDALDDVDLDAPTQSTEPSTAPSAASEDEKASPPAPASPLPTSDVLSPTSFPPPPSAAPLSSTHSTTAFLTTPSPTPPTAAGMERCPSSASLSGGGSAPAGAKVWGVLCVGFHHALGPNVEFAYPKKLMDDDELTKNLPFLALPDGAHAREEDYSYFHLLLPSVSGGQPQTIFGISCNRQIAADVLLNKGKDVTRSTVQKAIVVLANKPIFGPLRDKLGVITRSFFAQRDFDDKSILVDLYQSFEPALTPSPGNSPVKADFGGEAKGKGREKVEEGEEAGRDSVEMDPEEGVGGDGGMYMGTSLRQLVYRFRFKTLMLLKLIMLQRRVMFFAASTPVEQLCNFQYSLVALIPALLTNLRDAAAPTLDTRAQRIRAPTSLKTSDRRSLIRYLGLPLDIFGRNSFFQPYLPLQQIDLLKTRSFLVGTTNSIFQQQRDCHIDVIVNIDTATVEILNPKLTPLVTLTAADRKWMDELVTLVDSSYNPSDPERPVGQGFVGSDDFLRGKFEEYVCSLLACVKFGEFLGRERGERAEMLLSAPELESYNPASFNESFINAFKHTQAYELWDRNTDEVIFDLVEPKHPMEGRTNALEDVGIRLVHGLHDALPLSSLNNLNLSQLSQLQLPAHLQQQLGQMGKIDLAQLNALGKPARERLSRGLSVGGEWFAGIRGQGQPQGDGAEAAPGEGADGSASGRSTPALFAGFSGEPAGAAGGGAGAGAGAGAGGTAPATPTVGTTFLAGVDVAKTGAAQLATGLGSLLGSARAKGGGFFNARSASPSSAPAPGLKPLSTAAAATVPVPTSPILSSPPQRQSAFSSSSPSLSSSPAAASTLTRDRTSTASSTSSTSAAASTRSTPTTSGGGGFGGFFGGLRRTLNPADAASAPPSPARAGAGGGGGGAAEKRTSSPSPGGGGGGFLSGGFPGWGSRPVSPSVAPPSSAAKGKSPSLAPSPLPNPSLDVADLADVEGLKIRDLDAERAAAEDEADEERVRKAERERARRKLEEGSGGGAGV